MTTIESLTPGAAVERVADQLVEAGALVIDMALLKGFPNLQVLIPDTMPLFVWVLPDRITDDAWQQAKETSRLRLLSVGAAVVEINSDAELDKLCTDLKAFVPKELAPALDEQSLAMKAMVDAVVDAPTPPAISNPMSFLD